MGLYKLSLITRLEAFNLMALGRAISGHDGDDVQLNISDFPVSVYPADDLLHLEHHRHHHDLTPVPSIPVV